MVYFSSLGMGQLSDYSLFLKTHWIASLKDALMFLIIYFLVAILLKNWHWGRYFTRKRVLLVLFFGFIWSAGIEYYHINLNNDWAYLSSMPLLPFIKVGLLPVLQMMILPLVAIWLSRRQLFS